MFPSTSGHAIRTGCYFELKRPLRLGLHSEFRVGIGHAIPSAMAMESEPLDSSKTLAAADSAPDLGVPGRKPSEHVLRHEMLAAMVEGAREGLCIMDPRSVLLHSNQVAGELLGFGPKEAAGRPVRDLGEERDFDWSLVGDVVTGRVAVSTIQTLRTGRKLLVSGVPIWSDDGELSFIVVTIREIT